MASFPVTRLTLGVVRRRLSKNDYIFDLLCNSELTSNPDDYRIMWHVASSSAKNGMHRLPKCIVLYASRKKTARKVQKSMSRLW